MKADDGLNSGRQLAFGSWLRAGMQGLVFLAIAAFLEPEEFGRFSAVVAFAGLASAICTVGAYPLTVREIGEQGSVGRSEGGRLIGLAFWSQMVALSGFLVPGLLLVRVLLPGVTMLALALAVVSSSLLNAVHISVASWALAHSNVRRAALYQVFRGLAILPIPSVILISEVERGSAIFALYSAGNLAGVVALAVVHRASEPICWPGLEAIMGRVVNGWRYSVGNFAESGNATADQLMFERSGMVAELGLYALLVRVFSYVLLVPAAAFDGNVAGQMVADSTRRRGFRSLLRRRLAGQAAVGAVLAASVGILLSVAFELGTLQTAIAVAIMFSFSLILNMQNRLNGFALIAEGRPTARSLVLLLSLLTNILLNLYMVVQYGAVGAAISTLFSEVLATILLSLLLGSKRNYRDKQDSGALAG